MPQIVSTARLAILPIPTRSLTGSSRKAAAVPTTRGCKFLIGQQAVHCKGGLAADIDFPIRHGWNRKLHRATRTITISRGLRTVVQQGGKIRCVIRIDHLASGGATGAKGRVV